MGYCRLSRDDTQASGIPIAEKLKLRRDVLVVLAKHNGICLTEENMVTEVESAGTLDERPGLLDILRRCEHKEIHTLIVFDIDRLTRDVGDWKRIERALFRGRVRLITGRGTYEFTPNFDPSMLQILAVMGEKERRSYGYRRKATNEQRTRNNQWSQGLAPYGYTWNKTTKTFEVVPDEYAIVEEIFRLVWQHGTDWIAAELNRRAVPAPGGTRRNAAPRWRGSLVHQLISNPVYAGYIVKRTDMDREGRALDLSREQWIWAEKEGGWPHPLTLPQWEALQEVRTGRLQGVPTSGLLTGLLYCAQGGKMQLRHPRYHCTCGSRDNAPHDGYTIRRFQLEDAIIGLVADTLAALPPLPVPQTSTASNVNRRELELYQVKRQLRDKEATLDDLARRAGFYINLPTIGTDGHARLLEAVNAEILALRARHDALTAQLEQPSARLSAPVLDMVNAAGGVRALCDAAPPEVARQLLRLIVARIDCRPKPAGQGRATTCVHVTLHPLRDGEAPRTLSLPIPHAYKGRTIATYTPQPVKRTSPPNS